MASLANHFREESFSDRSAPHQVHGKSEQHLLLPAFFEKNRVYALYPSCFFAIVDVMLPVRVYYEDTDCGGVVYYANYLKYFERGRTEFLRERGISVADAHDKGIVFVVTKVEVEYREPGRYNDLLFLETRLAELSAITLTFLHSLKREGSDKEMVKGKVVLAAVNRDGKPMRIPDNIKKILRSALDRKNEQLRTS